MVNYEPGIYGSTPCESCDYAGTFDVYQSSPYSCRNGRGRRLCCTVGSAAAAGWPEGGLRELRDMAAEGIQYSVTEYRGD